MPGSSVTKIFFVPVQDDSFCKWNRKQPPVDEAVESLVNGPFHPEVIPME
jgi:hypothetical protein